jgi:hypothetical protein
MPDVTSVEIRAYLVGALEQARAEALEARYLVEPVLAEAMRAEEDGLIDDYLADRLTAVDRARFESHYLASPVHRDRVAVARALADRAAAAAPKPSAGPRFYGWMAAAAAVVALSLWVAGRPGPLPQQAQAPTPVPGVPSPTPSPEPPTAPTPAPTPGVRAALAIALSPLAVRGVPAPPAVVLPPGPLDLRLSLEGTPVAGDRVYDVELQTVEGRVVWRGRVRAAPADSGFLATPLVPGETLSPDDYVVMVSAGGAERARYLLRLREPR